MNKTVPIILTVLALAGTALAGRGRNWERFEITFSGDERKKLDTFEGVLIDKADKMYGKEEYKTALPLYKRFLMEYPRSRAVSYAVLRKARCLHQDGKRYEAIKQYNEVLDYFPNDIKYAAAALFYQGLAHWQNGHKKDAMKCWAEIAQDKDYRTHFLAATAINRLADYLAETNEVSKAIPYYQQVALDFRRKNETAARHAIHEVAEYYIRIAPNEAKLREFYEKTKTFHDRPRSISGKTIENSEYWDTIRNKIRHYSKWWPEEQKDKRGAFFKYWAQQMEGKFPKDDDFQIDLANYHFQHEQSRDKWVKRLDEQFVAHQKAGDYDRIIRWIRMYAGMDSKVAEYYTKLDLQKMSADQLISLMKVCYEDLKDTKMGANVFQKIPLADLPDDRKSELAHYMKKKDIKISEALCQSFKDKELGQFTLLTCYNDVAEYEKGIKLATEVSNIPEYAQQALWIKGGMYQATKKYKEAISAYRQCDLPPDNLWEIASCYEKLGQIGSAITQLQEVEAFFKDVSSEAALRIAKVYGRADGRKRANTKYVAALRAVLKKYPKSSQSSYAHEELERMKVKTGGGVDAE